METQKVAVVILNWNGKSWLEKFLPNTISKSQSADIYVVDNASSDDSVDFFRQTEFGPKNIETITAFQKQLPFFCKHHLR